MTERRKLRMFRYLAGLSQSKLARLAGGIHPSIINKIEMGKSEGCSEANMKAIADALSQSLGEKITVLDIEEFYDKAMSPGKENRLDQPKISEAA